MRNVNIQQSICEAIETIIQRRLSDAQFNKTFVGTVEKVQDESLGTYSVREKDRRIVARSSSPDIKYELNTDVYIINPNNMSNTFFIIGAVEPTTTVYTDIKARDKYNIVGMNCLNGGDLKLSSYKNQNIVLYDYTEENENLINVDQQIAKRYIPQAQGIVLGANFRTNFASSQNGGNYGLRFYLTFQDENDADQSAETVKTFTVDVKDVIGNPYGLGKATPVEQVSTNFDTGKFIRVEKIEAFVENFPTDESKEQIKDIFITDIKIYGIDPLTEEELNGYSVYIDYSETGNVLEGETKKVKFTAVLKVKGVVVTNDTKYYWFKENATVYTGHEKYSSRGGPGWECINPYEGKTPSPGSDTFYFISQGDEESWIALTDQKKLRIKCVVVYNDIHLVTGESQVLNKTPHIDINIVSSDLLDNGQNRTKYYLDAGEPTLTCNVVQDDTEIEGKYEYIWTVAPEGKNPQIITPITQEQEEQNTRTKEIYLKALQDYFKVPEVDRQTYLEESNFEQKKAAYEACPISWVIDNVYYNFPIKNIVNTTRISCAVQKVFTEEEQEKRVYLGTTSIVLQNSHEIEGNYSLDIVNGAQVFQYDKKGNSPASPILEKPLVIHELTFTLYNNIGEAISHDQIKQNGYIKWYFPNNKDLTLLVSKQDTDIATAADQFDVYENLSSFSYSIADTYDSKKTMNYMMLQIKLQDLIMRAYTDFTFAKQGDPGTNGTDIVAKLVPYNNDTQRIYLPFYGNDGIGDAPFGDNGGRVDYLQFQLYNNSRKVQGLNYSSVLAQSNRLNPYITDDQVNFASVNPQANGCYEIRPSIFPPVVTDEEGLQNFKPINILRAICQPQGNVLKYYAEFPINVQYAIDRTYRFKLRPRSGYKYVVYASDCTSPDYDNTLPFEVFVETYEEPEGAENGYFIENNDSRFTYEWSVIGNLEQPIEVQGEPRKVNIKPKDIFDSSDLTSAVIVKIFYDLNPIGYIHIPIYMLINRYNNAALNDWDGNGISLDKDNNQTLLAPQIGAGKKEEDNSFTGIFMGTVKDDRKNHQDRTGLFGYSKGQQSMFLDAESGKSIFGIEENGQIVIDPQNNKAQIYSGNYVPATSETSGSGMLIDFTTPQIKFGSGKFNVNANGQITSTSGTIGGWTIGQNTLTSKNGNVFLSSTANGVNISAGGGKFTVSSDGSMQATTGTIANWKIEPKSLTDGNIGLGEKTFNTPNVFDKKIYSKIWGTDNNSKLNFAVSTDGTVYSNNGHFVNMQATSGTIKNASIENDSVDSAHIKNANIQSGKIGGITIESGCIKGTGFEITPSYAQFSGLYINNNGQIKSDNSGAISAGGATLDSNGTTFTPNKTYMNLGEDRTQTFDNYIVDNLIVNSSFTYDGKLVQWRDVSLVTGITRTTKQVTIGAETFYVVTSVGSISQYFHLLTTEQTTSGDN